MNTIALPMISATGSLESYIQTINRFPLLTQEQETEYARRLRDSDDIEAARHLVYHAAQLRDAGWAPSSPPKAMAFTHLHESFQ